MRLTLDSRRLTPGQVSDLLNQAGMASLSASLLAHGFRPCATKAARRLPPDGRLPLRMTWTRKQPGGAVTLRLSGTIEVDPV